MFNVVSVIGARPQFIKAAVVSRALRRAGIAEQVVHTGQHYDDAMSGRFLQDLGLSVTANLAVGSASHAHQTAAMMTGFQDFLNSCKRQPDAVIVYGDTNSTLAAGLVVSKIGVPLVHVEAGLRSWNRTMPEEINRVMVDHLSDLLFCSSDEGVGNLGREGIEQGVHKVGDVMLDAFQAFSGKAVRRPLHGLSDGAGFVLATIHRPSNTDSPARLARILDQFGRLDMPVVWPVHPRNKMGLSQQELPTNLTCIEPVSYLEMLGLLRDCAAVVTDSGGLQKEAHWARRPCVTLRPETEWIETLDGGWNQLADPASDDVAELLRRKPTAPWTMLYGDGRASDKIVANLTSFLKSRR